MIYARKSAKKSDKPHFLPELFAYFKNFTYPLDQPYTELEVSDGFLVEGYETSTYNPGGAIVTFIIPLLFLDYSYAARHSPFGDEKA